MVLFLITKLRLILTRHPSHVTDFLERSKKTLIIFLKKNPSLILDEEHVSFSGNILDEEHVSFHSKQEIVFELTDLEDLYKKMFAKILESFSTYVKNGSGWTLKSVVKMQITRSSSVKKRAWVRG